MKAKRSALEKEPRYFRAPKSVGGEPKVDRTGGYQGQGLIRSASIVTRGEALGHDLWLDSDFVGSVSDAINAQANGVKMRFTHPGLSSDGMGKFLGRAMTSTKSTDGSQAFADAHFSSAAHKSPDGDLAEYTMDLADDDPDSFGISIVFKHDADAEKLHFTQNGGQITVDPEDGWESWDDSNFKSPDPDNVQNFQHARLAVLRGADVVDEPAANPDGLFHREQQFAQEATGLAAYALGITKERPAVQALGLDADRVAGFVTRYLHDNQLEVVKMKTTFSAPPADEKPADESQSTDTAPAADEAKPGEEKPADEKPADPPSETLPPNTEQQSAGKRFVEAFGDVGARWFLEGKSFEECAASHSAAQQKELSDVREENAKLKKQLAANPVAGETEPIKFSNGDPNQKPKEFASKIRIASAPVTQKK